MTRNCTAHTCCEGHAIRLGLHHCVGKLAINYQRDGHVVFGLGVRGNVKLLHPGAEHARHILERPAQEVRAGPSHLCRRQHISPGEPWPPGVYSPLIYKGTYGAELAHRFDNTHLAGGDAGDATRHIDARLEHLLVC